MKPLFLVKAELLFMCRILQETVEKVLIKSFPHVFSGNFVKTT